MKTHYIGHDDAYKNRKANGFIGWGEDADNYKSIISYVNDAIKNHNIPKRGKLLELGCGAGNISFILAKLGFQISGIDIAPTAITWAQELAERHQIQADFRVGDVVNLNGYSADSFDVLLDGHCLHCIIGDDRAKFLSNSFRVLKPGGFFITETMCGDYTGEFGNNEHFDPETRCTYFKKHPFFDDDLADLPPKSRTML